MVEMLKADLAEAELQCEAGAKKIEEMEAERQATIEAVIPPNRDKCTDCGHSLVWQWMEGAAAAMSGPSRLICPRCVFKRMQKAEAERDELVSQDEEVRKADEAAVIGAARDVHHAHACFRATDYSVASGPNLKHNREEANDKLYHSVEALCEAVERLGD
jgi:DNA-directed RNA polymerase subunit RPC12/RpoP